MPSLRSLSPPAALAVSLCLALLPTSAQADAAAAPAAPLGMRDVEPRSSVGVEADFGHSIVEGARDGDVQQLVVDGEFAFGAHGKLFSQLRYGFGYDEDGKAESSPGNLTLGGQLQLQRGELAGAVGGDASFFGGIDAQGAVFLHDDVAAYFSGALVLQGFATLRWARPAFSLQAQLTYLHYDQGYAPLNPTYDTVRGTLGGGLRLVGALWALAEIGYTQELHFHDEPTDLETSLVGQAGVRGRFGNSPASWAVRASVAHRDTLYGGTTYSIGVELRADLRTFGI